MDDELKALLNEIPKEENDSSESSSPPIEKQQEDIVPEWYKKFGQATGIGEGWKPLAYPYAKNMELPQGVPMSNREAIANQLEAEEMLQGLVALPMEAASTVAHAALAPLQAPQQALTGLVARTAAAASKYDQGVSEMKKAFKSPPLMELARKRAGFQPELEATLEQAKNSGNWDTVRAYINEIFPEAYPSDLVGDQNFEAAAKLVDQALTFGDGSESPQFQSFLNGAMRFGVDVVSDPLMYTGFLGKIPTPSKKLSLEGLSETEKVAVKLIEAAKEQERLAKLPQGMRAEAQRGERAFMQVKIPFVGNPVTVIKGEKILGKLDEIGAFLERTSAARPLLTDSGIGGFTALDTAHEMSQAANPSWVEATKEKLLTAGLIDPPTAKLASEMAEFGEDLAIKKNPKATADQIEQARMRVQIYNSINTFGNAELQRASGIDLTGKGLKYPSVEDQQKIMKRLTKEHGPFSPLLLSDGNLEHDLTFSHNYDFGRELSKEAKAAKGLEKDLELFDNATRSSGLLMRPDSSKSRVALSTEVFDGLLRKKYGLSGPAFNPNKDEVVLGKLASKLKAANDIRFVKSVKEAYGLTKEEIPQFIEDAAQRVRLAKKSGGVVNLDDLKFSRMKPEDFKPIDSRVFEQMKYIGKNEVGMMFAPQELYYPKQIADRVETKFFRPQQGKILATWDALQKAKAKNMITSIYRIGKQPLDNFFKAMSLDVGAGSIFKELAASAGHEDDITRLYKHIPTVNETVLDFKEYDVARHGIDVSVPMLADPDVNNATNAWLGGAWEKVKATGSWATGIKELKPGILLDVANDNIASRTVRSMGNYSDGLMKKAYFRDLIKKGYSPAEATRMVGDHLMDFGRGTRTARGLRYLTPFAAFKLKNLETLPILVAMKPGVTNAINPFNGSLKRAIETASGWDPWSSQKAEKFVPYFRHPILGPLLRGNDEIADSPEMANGFLNEYIRWHPSLKNPFTEGKQINERVQNRLNGAMLLSFDLPTNLNAALDMFDLTRYNEQMYNPILSAAAIGFWGYDAKKEKLIPGSGTEFGDINQITKALSELNPVDYPRFYNKVVMPQLEKMMPSIRERLKSPVPRRLAQLMKLQLGPEFRSQQLELDKRTLDELTSLKFFGMGRLDKADFNYQMQQMMLLKKAEELGGKSLESGLLEKTIGKDGRAEGLAVQAGINRLLQKMKENSLIYRDFKERMKALPTYLTEDEKALIFQTQTRHDEAAKPNIQVEADDPTLDFDEAEQESQDADKEELLDMIDEIPPEGANRKPDGMLVTEPRGHSMFDVASNASVGALVKAPNVGPDKASLPEDDPLQDIDRATIPLEEESEVMEFEDLPGPPPKSDRSPASRQRHRSLQ